MEFLIPVFFAAIVHMVKPGPYIMAITSLVISGKIKSVMIFWITYITVSTFTYLFFLGSMSVIPQSFGIVFIFIKATAAIIFINMGISNLRTELNIDQEKVEANKEKITANTVLQIMGAATFMCLSNPFDIVLIVGVIPGLTGMTSFTLTEILLIRGTTLAANILVLVSYCVPLFFLRKAFNKEILNKIRYVTSFAMIGIGVYIFVNMIMQGDLYKTGLLG